MIDRELIVEMLKERFVTRRELCEMFNLTDRRARLEVQRLKLLYPVISSRNRRGWKIAVCEADIPLAEESVAENRRKAITLLKGQKRLREFLETFDKEGAEQLTLEL